MIYQELDGFGLFTIPHTWPTTKGTTTAFREHCAARPVCAWASEHLGSDLTIQVQRIGCGHHILDLKVSGKLHGSGLDVYNLALQVVMPTLEPI